MSSDEDWNWYAPKRAMSNNMNVIGLTKLYQLLLGKERMEFYLVSYRVDLGCL